MKSKLSKGSWNINFLLISCVTGAPKNRILTNQISKQPFTHLTRTMDSWKLRNQRLPSRYVPQRDQCVAVAGIWCDGCQAYESDAEDHEALDANLLAARIAAEGNKGPRPRRWVVALELAWSVYCTMCPVLGCPNPQQTPRTWRYSVRTRGKSEEVLKLKVSVFSYY